MRGRLSKRTIDAATPGPGVRFIWDTELPRFGLKVTPAGVRTYVIFYRIGRRSRRLAIGRHGQPWTLDMARREATRLLGLVAAGRDPAETRHEGRRAPTMRELAGRVALEHLTKRAPATRREYARLFAHHILPALGGRAVADVTRADVARLHHDLAATPMQANRVLAVLSKSMNLAERWGLRPDGSNPCRHIEKNRERPRERYLSVEELGRLGRTLDAAARGPLTLPDGTRAPLLSPFALAALGLLVLTGARVSEILALTWERVDLDRGLLWLAESKTGARVVHLNAGARAILEALPRVEGNPHVIVGGRAGARLVNIAAPWTVIRRHAGLDGVRPHDLRHSFASVGAGAGLGLPMIGGLLGHTQAATTKRYAHLADGPLHDAAELIGGRLLDAMTDAAPTAEPGS